ncbi:hypothetical protein ACTA71_002546 [Dictyostelium dimigraforme]
MKNIFGRLGKIGKLKSLGRENKKKGMDFEGRVVKMLESRLCFNIKRNVVLKDKHNNRSEIDIVYGIFFKRYIECKCYDNSPVPLEDVAKFKEVLSLNNISIRRGLFFTSSIYVPRATKIGIQTIDGDQLRKMELRSPFIGILKFVFYCAVFTGFCGLSIFIFNHYKNNFEIGRKRRSEGGSGYI